MGWVVRLKRRLFGRSSFGHGVFAPDYDAITAATAAWTEGLNVGFIPVLRGNRATHEAAFSVCTSQAPSRRFLFFIGHGRRRGLLTAGGIGRRDSAICELGHGCLLDESDLVNCQAGVQIVAWACSAGSDFGRAVASIREAGFIGFSDEISFIYGNSVSESLWSAIVASLFRRVYERGGVKPEDAAWLKGELMAARRAIIARDVEMGHYAIFNRMFLKRASKLVCVYMGRRT